MKYVSNNIQSLQPINHFCAIEFLATMIKAENWKSEGLYSEDNNEISVCIHMF